MLRPVTDITFLKALLHKHGITPERSSGQNFLISSEVIEAAMTVILEGPKNVTELAAGPGALTQALAAHNFTVRTIERDAALVKLLPAVLPPQHRKNVTIIHDDLRNVSWSWNEDYQLAGNIPYNISGLILRGITQLEPAPKQVVLLVQKEVGERLTATPPDMSLVSLAIQLWGTAEKVINVPAGCFWPAPKVSSQLVLLRPHTKKEHIPLKEREAIMTTARQPFQGKRKQLIGTLTKSTGLDRTTIEVILNTAHVSPNQRPQELTPQQWRAIHNLLQQNKK